MTVAQNKILLAQKLFQTNNKEILKAVEPILDPQEEYFELSASQKKELDVTLAEHKAGKLNYCTLEEAKKIILKKRD
jgi:hypothetical protein